MRILVTGGAGFIGSEIVRALFQHDPLVIDTKTGTDARDYFRRSADYFDAVVHCAAQVGGRRVIDWTPIRHAENLEIDAALFQWAVRARPGRVVYFSSSCAYPAELGHAGRTLHENDIDLKNPRWPDELYGWAKLTGELLAATTRAAGVPVTVVRPFSVYGPGMNDGFAVRGFLDQAQRRADPIVIWGDDQQTRDYIHVSDVARAVAAIIERDIEGPVNLGTGYQTSLEKLARVITADYGPQIKVDPGMPAGIKRLVADATRLREFCPPAVGLEDGLAGMTS